jgi:hypothetical protein
MELRAKPRRCKVRKEEMMISSVRVYLIGIPLWPFIHGSSFAPLRLGALIGEGGNCGNG